MNEVKLQIAITSTVFLFSLFAAPVTQAATYWASPQGSDTAACSDIWGTSDPGRYGSFARAVGCATRSGDQVYAKPGIYTSDVTIANPSNGITIRGSDSANWPILQPTGSSVRGVNFYNTTRSGIVLKYLRWDMSNVATAQNCINVSSDAVVSYTLEDFECVGPRVGAANRTASGIKVGEKNQATIRRGTIRRWHSADSQPGAHGFYWSGSNGLVEHVEVSDVNGYCLQWYSGAGAPPNNNIFRYNKCSAATNKGGIYIQGNSVGNQVYDNVFVNVKTAIASKTTNAVISNNNVSTGSAPTAAPGTPGNLQAVSQ